METNKTNNQNSISLRVAISKIATAAFLIFFLFVSYVSAQNIRDFVSPHAACQFYYNQDGFTIIRDLEHECLVRNGNSQTGFIYTRFYDSGNNFCFEVTSSWGQIIAPQCIPISQTGRAQQQQEDDPNKIVTPPSFRIKELQYDTLPTGKPIQAGENERIEITMPDGSLIQLDANATFTPVSEYEVHSVFGRFRYLWQPFHDGNCIVGQNLVRQACRRVMTPDAALGARGTEFLVEVDESGTLVMVLEGLLGVADLAGKKTVEVAGGQSTFIKQGGLPEDPKPFDPAEIERWWEKKTSEQIGIIFIEIIVGLIIFFVILSSIKKLFRKKSLAVAIAPVNKYCANCGVKILEGAGFCSGCGRPLSDIPVGIPVTKKKRNLLMRVILLIVILLLMFLLLAFLLF
jgi:hypothetical protein